MTEQTQLSKPGPIEFGDKLLENGIYDADLHNGKLKAFISPSRNTAVGAVVNLWVGENSRQASGAYLKGTVHKVMDAEQKLEVHFAVEELRPYTKKMAYFGYNIDNGLLSSTVPLYVNIS